MATVREVISMLEALPEDQKDMDLLVGDNDGWYYDIANHRTGKVFEGKEVYEGTENEEASEVVFLY